MEHPSKSTLIEEAHDTVKKIRIRVDSMTSTLAAEKKMLDAAIKFRDRVIELGEDALKEQQSLFNQPPAANGNGHAKAEKPKKPTKAEANAAAIDAAAAPDESWKGRPIMDAIKVGAVVNGLDSLEKPVRTLGELAAWLNEPGNTLRNLPGVGEDKMNKALDQLADFWKANPQFNR